MLRDVGGMACWCMKVWTFDIFWYRDKNIDIISNASFFVIALDFNDESDLSVGWILNNNINRK